MLVKYKNATISQEDGTPILSNVDFQIGEGEFVYIIGRVGSGKSSLLKSIYFELDIDEADEATVLGTDLLSIKRKQVPALRKQMGIIFQDFQLLSDRSIYSNLLFVLEATGWNERLKMEQRVEEVLEQMHLKELADKMPHELSGGEQQRAAIARAILNSPKLIVADEPTGNLDTETADDIANLLRQVSLDGTAVIMSTHNMQLVDKYPGTVYKCYNGQLEKQD